MKKRLLLFFVLTHIIYSQVTELVIGEKIEINREEETTFTLKKVPAYSSWFYLSQSGLEFSFAPDVAGSYVVEVEGANGKVDKEYIVTKKEEYQEAEIYDIIDEALKSGDNELVEKMVEEIFANNPQSASVKEYLVRYIDYLAKKQDRVAAFEVYKVLNAHYKLSKGENIEILNIIYEAKDEVEELDLEVLKLLSYFDNDYTYELAKNNLKLGVNSEKSIVLVRSRYDRYLDREAAKILAEYYIENEQFREAEKYLKLVDKLALSKKYLDRSNFLAYEYIYLGLSEEEQKELDEYKKSLEDEETVKLYFEKAMLNMKNERYEIADIYFKRVMRLTIDERLRKESVFYIGKMYLDERKLNESLLVFNTYMKEYGDIRDAEARYSLGIIQYELKNYEESDKMFNQVIELYPDTVWSTRASIYKLKIKNKLDKGERDE